MRGGRICNGTLIAPLHLVTFQQVLKWPRMAFFSAMVRAMLTGPADRIDLSTVKRALVVKLRHHGDVLLTSPVFSTFKAHAPHLKIDALVYADTRDMLTLHPAVDEVLCIDRAWKSAGFMTRLAAEWRLLSTLRGKGYDLLIHLSEHPRGAWLARTLGCRHAVAPGYANKPEFWKRSFTHRFALPKNALRHMVDWNLDALRRIGVQPAGDDRKLVLVPGAEADAQASALLRAHAVAAGEFIHIHPASRWQFKCWPVERMAALVHSLVQRGERVVLTAAPTEDERQQLSAILDRSRVRDQVIDLSGQLSLKGLAALTARARLFVGVDSAPMHIAAAMGTPVVALFGPSGDAEWAPWEVPHRVVSSSAHRCRPCGNDGCGGGKVSECLTTLPESAVMAAIDALLMERRRDRTPA